MRKLFQSLQDMNTIKINGSPDLRRKSEHGEHLFPRQLKNIQCFSVEDIMKKEVRKETFQGHRQKSKSHEREGFGSTQQNYICMYLLIEQSHFQESSPKMQQQKHDKTQAQGSPRRCLQWQRWADYIHQQATGSINSRIHTTENDVATKWSRVYLYILF